MTEGPCNYIVAVNVTSLTQYVASKRKIDVEITVVLAGNYSELRETVQSINMSGCTVQLSWESFCT